MKRAAIDIGSNTLRLLVTDDGAVVRQDLAETRLGDGFRDGKLTAAAMERTLAALGRWLTELKAEGIDAPTIFATSAVRDAANKGDFIAALKGQTGCSLQVFSGEEEAYYAFTGAVGGFDFPQEECLLIDIGGGSTELAAYQGGKLAGFSVPVGAVRWQMLGLRREEVKARFAAELTLHPFDGPRRFIAVGGTATTAAAILNEVAVYSREAIHGKTLTYAAVTDLERRLAAMTVEERRAVVGMTPKRAEIITYGLTILAILFEVLSIDTLYVSDYGILDGVIAVQG